MKINWSESRGRLAMDQNGAIALAVNFSVGSIDTALESITVQHILYSWGKHED